MIIITGHHDPFPTTEQIIQADLILERHQAQHYRVLKDRYQHRQGLVVSDVEAIDLVQQTMLQIR